MGSLRFDLDIAAEVELIIKSMLEMLYLPPTTSHRIWTPWRAYILSLAVSSISRVYARRYVLWKCADDFGGELGRRRNTANVLVIRSDMCDCAKRDIVALERYGRCSL
jgi:hypothetical protein